MEKVPLLLLVAGSATVTFLTQQSAGAVISLESVPIGERIARAAVLYVAYLGKIVWPVSLALYPAERLESYRLALGAAILLALLTAGAVWGARRGQPWLAVGWFWYLITLAPTIGLVQAGLQVRADRFTYLPQIGICIALVWGAAALSRFLLPRGTNVQHSAGELDAIPLTRGTKVPLGKRDLLGRWACGTAALLVVAGLTVCAWRQTQHWRDGQTLWTHALDCTSANFLAHDLLGGALADRGQAGAAIAHFQMALEIQPDDPRAHNNLGVALARRGQFDAAVDHYRKALKFGPDDSLVHSNLGYALAERGQVNEAVAEHHRALEINPENAEAHNGLGVVLAGRGEADAAIAEFRKALEIKPDYAEAHNNMGHVLEGRGQFDTAVAQYRKALEIKPDYAEVHYNFGVVLVARGQVDEAIDHYQKALEIKSDYAEAHCGLGLALAGRRQIDAAVAEYQKALEVKPDYAEAHNNLGAALAGRRQFDAAIVHFQKAVEIKPDYVDARRNLATALSAREGSIRSLPNNGGSRP